MCCLPVSDDRRMKGVICAVRLVISVNEIKCTRIALCKGIYGPIARTRTLIQDFSTRAKLL